MRSDSSSSSSDSSKIHKKKIFLKKKHHSKHHSKHRHVSSSSLSSSSSSSCSSKSSHSGSHKRRLIKKVKILKKLAIITRRDLDEISLLKSKLRADVFNASMVIKVYNTIMDKLIDKYELYVPYVFRRANMLLNTATQVDIKIGSEVFNIGGNLLTEDTNADLLTKLDTTFMNHRLFLKFLKLKHKCYLRKVRHCH